VRDLFVDRSRLAAHVAMLAVGPAGRSNMHALSNVHHTKFETQRFRALRRGRGANPQDQDGSLVSETRRKALVHTECQGSRLATKRQYDATTGSRRLMVSSAMCWRGRCLQLQLCSGVSLSTTCRPEYGASWRNAALALRTA